MSIKEMGAIVARIGCAIVGASADVAPADKRLYAVRDISGTVESIDLITASILSKKLAAGLGALVLDVKCGSGAFMKSRADAEALARSLVSTANGAGCRTAALLTDMDQPLGRMAGNALEVVEVMDLLTGRADSPALRAVTVALGGEALFLAGLAASAAEGEARIAATLSDGRAAARLDAMIAAQGGPDGFSACYGDVLPKAPVVQDVPADGPGIVTAIDGEALGLAVVRLGGGRMVETDRIDPAVGLSALARLGERVGPEVPLARVHAAGGAAADAAAAAVRAAYRIGEAAPAVPPAILGRIGA
jgi:thymidine phosphorylase